jgi:hypothetical protein
MANQIVPLDTSAYQSFSISLQVDGATLTLQLSINYNQLAGYWVMSIADANGKPLVSSVPLVGGVWPAGNLLQQFSHLKIGSAYIINASGVASDHPNSSNLGSSYVLVWGDTAS